VKTIFLRLVEAGDKAAALLRIIGDPTYAQNPQRFYVDPADFVNVPRSPFAYWISENIRRLFKELPSFEGPERLARRGPSTCDDARYVRCWWEVESAEPHGHGIWRAYAKGGAFSPFFSDIHLVVDWEPRRSTFLGFFGRPGREIEKPESVDYFFRPGLTWPRRTTSGISVRAMPGGCIFADKGPAAFAANDDSDELLALLAIMNSRPFSLLMSLQLAAVDVAARSYEVGIIQTTPIPNLADTDRAILSRLARHGWSLMRTLDGGNETSHAFVLPNRLNERVAGCGRDGIRQKLDALHNEINAAAFALYDIRQEDRTDIAGAATAVADLGEAVPEQVDDDGDVGADDDASDSIRVDPLISWLFGVVFGRFDPRLATGERTIPREPEPFDPLPSRSPGMYPEGEEPAELPDILVEDEGHPFDLATRIIAVAERVRAEVPENLRAWLAKSFFPLHIKMYSKSRRKAPIYWQLATPSAGYSVWIYIHAFSKDTLFRVQNDYVAPKLAHEERRLESLTSELRNGATAGQRKELAAQESFVEELRSFLDEVKRVAPLWNPNLDDGVIINFAPLWRLVLHHKPWQKELKLSWDALCEGKYDWAHLAMHLWPERVVPKCAKDRSLAIAHGLEDVFWAEGTDRKWDARKTPMRDVDELVRESTSPAVKSALESLVEASAAPGNGGRGRGGRRRATAFVEGGDA